MFGPDFITVTKVKIMSLAVFMLEARDIKVVYTYLTSETFKSTGVKMGCVKLNN